MNQYQIYFFAFLFILLTTIILFYFVSKSIIQSEIGRKMLHLITICICTYVVRIVPDRFELGMIFLFFVFILFWLVKKKHIFASERESYGIALFPLAFSIMLFSSLRIDAIVFGMMTLGISDAMAGLVGTQFGKNKFMFFKESKSWPGFLAFLGCTVIIGYYFFGLNILIVLVALVPALSELFSFKGSDNLSVPIIAAYWFQILNNGDFGVINLVSTIVIGIILFIVYHRKWLDLSGVIAAFLFSLLVVYSSDVRHILPLSLFFVVGSLSSKMYSQSSEKEGRNAEQVFANGIVAVFYLCLFTLTNAHVYLVCFLGSICISFTDTISSDLGTYFKGKTYDIISFSEVGKGLSGGVSFYGTFAGLAISVFYSIVVLFVFKLTISEALMITSVGFLGMLLDSVIGSVYQVKYKIDHTISEVNEPLAILWKGYSWIDNNMVNFLSNAITILMLFLLIY